MPVPVPAPLTSTPSACLRVCSRQGWAHRPRARDRAAPSKRDGAIEHVNCATATLHMAPVRRWPRPGTSPEGPTGARVRRRRAVALVSEIATPSNTSAPLPMATAPPLTCTRVDAEGSGALFSCMRSRDASGGGKALATCASMRRMRLPRARASMCVCCDGCSTCYQSARIASRPSRRFYKYYHRIFLLNLAVPHCHCQC